MTLSDRPEMNKGLIASRVVEALLKGRGATTDELATAIDMKRSTLYNRLAKGDWKFTELVEVAEALNEPFSSFIDGLGGRFLHPSIRPAVGGRGGDTPRDSPGVTRKILCETGRIGSLLVSA